jgi:prophage antirepressor-like protein
MMDIQIFSNNEFGELQVIEINGKPYFPATHCAEILGYERPHDAISRHCPHSVKHGVGVQTGTTAKGAPAIQTVSKTFIPEGDLYRLIVRSKLPAAERFEKWVFDEVLPSIRQHGFYATDVVIDNLLNNPDTIIGILKADKHERDMRRETETQLEAVTIRLDEHGQWLSIKRVAAINHWRWQNLDWRRLKAASLALGYGVQKVDDQNYGKVNAYHIDIWRRVYPNLRLCGEAAYHE